MTQVKTEFPGLVRDMTSTAVINTDNEAFRNYRTMREDKLKILRLNSEVSSLKTDIELIKNLLIKTLEKQG